MSKAGDLLGERYRVVEVLSGGMGEVYICDWLERKGGPKPPGDGRQRRVALKTFQRRYFFDQATRLSFIREASTWLRLSGLPHILPALGIEQIGDRPFLEMMAVERGPDGERSIADLLRGGPIAPHLALKYALQLAVALQMAGKRLNGLAHGDLKPANILLISGDAFLADFGLASAAPLGRADHRLQSTWAYCAPELWGDDQQTPGAVSDIYAFGTLLFEMLCGRTPFSGQGHDRATWQEAHRHLKPVAPKRLSSQPMAADAMKLALACLAKEPGQRPGSFAAIVDGLNRIYKEHDPVGHLMVLVRARELDYTFRKLPGFLEMRIAGLLQMEEPAQALEELNAIPEGEYSPVLWLRRGTALSLLNRDSEALDSFERAERGGLPSEDLVNCRVEYALSLKRLGRFREAESIYEQLLTSVPDEQLPLVIVNLATVYLQQKSGSKTVNLLEPFVRRNPGSALAWANLGQAYVFVGRYLDAEKAYGRALVAAPQEGRVRTNLAALYMDHLGRLEDAWAALDAAFDSGHEGREWLVRMLTCSILLNKKDTVNGLMYALQHTIERESAQSMIEEAKAMVESLVKKYSRAGGETAAEPEEKEEADEEVVEKTQQEAPATVGEPAKARMPFLNFRFYETLDFTLDFYENPTKPEFLETFANEWRRAMRDPRLAMGGTSLRGSPFYFTRCPNCRVYVLTNRDLGYRISCRMCDTRWQTDSETGSGFEPLLREISDVVGIRGQEEVPMVLALWVQPSKDVSLDQIDDICKQGGFERWKNDTLLSIHLLQQAIKSGAPLELPWGMWALESTPAGFWAKDATPQEVASVVRQIQRLDSHARTISTELTAEQAGSMRTTAKQVEAEMEETSRQAIRGGRATATDYRIVANALGHRGELEQAERYARAAVAADEQSAQTWECLGLILFKREDFAGASEALERTVALDRSRGLALQALAICLTRLGITDRAREIQSRANSISGREFQG